MYLERIPLELQTFLLMIGQFEEYSEPYWAPSEVIFFSQQLKIIENYKLCPPNIVRFETLCGGRIHICRYRSQSLRQTVKNDHRLCNSRTSLSLTPTEYQSLLHVTISRHYDSQASRCSLVNETKCSVHCRSYQFFLSLLIPVVITIFASTLGRSFAAFLCPSYHEFVMWVLHFLSLLSSLFQWGNSPKKFQLYLSYSKYTCSFLFLFFYKPSSRITCSIHPFRTHLQNHNCGCLKSIFHRWGDFPAFTAKLEDRCYIKSQSLFFAHSQKIITEMYLGESQKSYFINISLEVRF